MNSNYDALSGGVSAFGGLGRDFGRAGRLGALGGASNRGLFAIRADTTLLTADVTDLLADRTSILVDSSRFTSDQSALSADYAR